MLVPPGQEPDVVLAALLPPLTTFLIATQAGSEVDSQRSRLQRRVGAEARHFVSGSAQFAKALSHVTNVQRKLGLLLARLTLLAQESVQFSVRYFGKREHLVQRTSACGSGRVRRISPPAGSGSSPKAPP